MPVKKDYGNESISMLKGEDRVRLRPAVIFGSDNLEGCIHSFFEILSNSIDEAREGHGDKIIITRYADGTIEVEDFGRGIPMDYNAKENSALTGNSFTANCTRAVSITITMALTMSIR